MTARRSSSGCVVLLLASSADAFLLPSRPALSFSRRAAVFMSEDPLEVARAALRSAEEAEAAALEELARLTSPEEAAAVISAVSRPAAVTKTNSTQPTAEDLVKNPVVVAAGVALLVLATSFLQGPPAPPSPPPQAVAKKAAQGSTQAMSQGDMVRKQTAEKQAKAAAAKAATAKVAAANQAANQAAVAKAATTQATTTQAMSPGDVVRKQTAEKQAKAAAAAKQKEAQAKDMASVRREGAEDGKKAANAARARARAKSLAKAKVAAEKERTAGRKQEGGGISPILAVGGAGLLGLGAFLLADTEEDTPGGGKAAGGSGKEVSGSGGKGGGVVSWYDAGKRLK